MVQCVHIVFISIWQPEVGLNKHSHIHTYNTRPTNKTYVEKCYWRLVNA